MAGPVGGRVADGNGSRWGGRVEEVARCRARDDCAARVVMRSVWDAEGGGGVECSGADFAVGSDWRLFEAVVCLSAGHEVAARRGVYLNSFRGMAEDRSKLNLATALAPAVAPAADYHVMVLLVDDQTMICEAVRRALAATCPTGVRS